VHCAPLSLYVPNAKRGMNTFGEISIVVVLLSLLLKLLFVDDDEDILPRYEKESELFVTNSLFTTVSFTRRISDTKNIISSFSLLPSEKKKKDGQPNIHERAESAGEQQQRTLFLYSLVFSSSSSSSSSHL
jgi:hypothetical protein